MNRKRSSASAAALAAAMLLSACAGASPAREKTEAPAVSSESLYVKKVEDLPADFILGMDVSSVLAEERSGVVYRGFDGGEQRSAAARRNTACAFSSISTIPTSGPTRASSSRPRPGRA